MSTLAKSMKMLRSSGIIFNHLSSAFPYSDGKKISIWSLSRGVIFINPGEISVIELKGHRFLSQHW